MNNKIKTLTAFFLAVLIGVIWYYRHEKDYVSIMAVTGATPLALKESAPSDFSFKVEGLVKKTYEFDSDAINAFASTRIRTREVSPDGKFLGTYIYTGVPVYNILEGIAPQKPKTYPFDRPLDMVVTFISKDGNRTHFSYGEITMVDDRHQLTLAYDRKELKPHEEKKDKPYDKNVFRGNIKGLKLISPRDADTARYLDNVVSIKLEVLETPDALLPKMKKVKNPVIKSIKCIKGKSVKTASFAGVKKQAAENWIRTGHGRGYKGISTATGYNLRDFLKKNFPGCNKNNYFMFIACDGYRTLFSGREIFSNEDGESYMLATQLDNKKASGNYMLAPIDDFFVDRDVWGLSHILILDAPK